MLSSSISPCCLSDHDFLDLHFQLVNVPTSGPGIWEFNAFLLRDSGFNDLISSRISELAEAIDSFADVSKWWDSCKNCLKAEIVAYSKEKRIRASHSGVVLTNRLIPLKQRLAWGDNSVKAEIASLELELKLLVSAELEGSKIRSRSRWFEMGEKPTRFFFQLERERSSRSSVSSILNSDDVEVFTRPEIEQAHVSFYSRLFSENFIDEPCKERCLSGIQSTLSLEQRDSCDGPFSLTELSNALKSLNLNRSPGLDGLTVEFYLHFWDVLAPLLLHVANDCFLCGYLPDSMTGSVTRLIFKKRGDRKCLKNWRPISLLNVDYKIFSKVITSRLSKVISFIIHPDQTCSIPGRSIFSKVTLLRDTLDYIERTNETPILVSLDQEKAFDRVNRSFLLDLLIAVGFGPDFCRWIATRLHAHYFE